MITSLRLQNFRSFDDTSVEFGPTVNVIVGPNASGKTNLLEAVLVGCQGKSYRVADEQLIKYHKTWARLDMVLDTNSQRTVALTRDPSKPAKKFVIDNNQFSRLPDRHKLPVVIFEPNQLINLTTSPELRRSLLDNLLEQLRPGFSQTRRDFIRALTQRNHLLKKPNQAPQQIFAWNIRFSQLAATLVKNRLELLAAMNQNLSATYSQLAGVSHELKIRYVSEIKATDYANKLLKKLEATLVTDIERGFTSYGPHRDDVQFSIDTIDLKAGASRGEVRTALLAYKINEATMLSASYSKPPYLLLDDVFGELDSKRRRTLAGMLKKYQTFITTTNADIATKKLGDAHLLTIK